MEVQRRPEREIQKFYEDRRQEIGQLDVETLDGEL